MTETILLTGATGYIASHTWVELLDAGYQVIGLDNLCNSNSASLERVRAVCGRSRAAQRGFRPSHRRRRGSRGEVSSARITSPSS